MDAVSFLARKHVLNILFLFTYAEKANIDSLQKMYPPTVMTLPGNRKGELLSLLSQYERKETRKKDLPKSLKSLKRELSKLYNEEAETKKTVVVEGGEKAVPPWQLRIGLFPKDVVEAYKQVFKVDVQRSNMQVILDKLVKLGLMEKRINPSCSDKDALKLHNHFWGLFRYMKRIGALEHIPKKRRKYFVTEKGKEVLNAIKFLSQSA